MNPFFFGTSNRRIFGIYEPAAPGASSKRAAIICYPWGSEYIYAHRAIRQLAIKLSAAGFHTLRFDFFGTGDSGGDLTDADLAGWETDVESAMEEIRDIAGISRITLFGMRLGANIAASVAVRHARKVDSLILWDPIVSGEEYLRQLGVGSQSTAEQLYSIPTSGNAIEVQGFLLTIPLMRDLNAIELGNLIFPPPTRTLMLVTERLSSHERLLPTPTGQGTGSLEIEFMTDTRPWNESSASDVRVPVGVIQRIVNWLG
jgi:pimeloyl-ACP methyl ester carboxylesterase